MAKRVVAKKIILWVLSNGEHAALYTKYQYAERNVAKSILPLEQLAVCRVFVIKIPGDWQKAGTILRIKHRRYCSKSEFQRWKFFCAQVILPSKPNSEFITKSDKSIRRMSEIISLHHVKCIVEKVDFIWPAAYCFFVFVFFLIEKFIILLIISYDEYNITHAVLCTVSNKPYFYHRI